MVTPEAAGPAAAGLISCIICLPPLIIQINQRNIAGSILIFSTTILNFMNAINALIWSSKDPSSWWDGRIFCDIQIRIFIGLEVSIAGAVACIFRQLSLVFHDSTRVSTKAQKRWTRFIEFTLCIAIPLVRMATFYVVQPDRYVIFRLRGCMWTMDSSWLGVLIMYGWQPTIFLLALVYAGLTAVRMFRHRQQTNSILRRTESQNNTTRIMRLYSFAVILLMAAVPIQAYVLYYSLPRQLEPFSWSRVHPPNWSERIFANGRLIWTPFTFVIPFVAVLFGCGIAILVGLAPDTISTYKIWLAATRDWTYCTSKKIALRFSSGDDLLVQHQYDNRAQNTNHELEAFPDGRHGQEEV